MTRPGPAAGGGAPPEPPACRGPTPPGAGLESRALIGRRQGSRAAWPMSAGQARRRAGEQELPGAAAPAV